jgi:glycosyltransferase involved in cell wall biosynthesis
MPILFLAEKFPPDIGGVAASAGRLATSLASLGRPVHVFALSRDLAAGSVERRELPAGAVLHRFGQSKNLDFTLQQALTYLEWLHGRHRFRLAWGHFAQNPGFLAAWLGRTLGIPSVVAVRGNDLDRQLFPPGDLARLEWSLKAATRVVCVSADLGRKVRALVEREADVLPNAVDTAIFTPRARPVNDVPILGFSGELRAKKGLTFLLQALDDVRRVRPVRLLVIGEVRGGDRGEWERMRIGLNLDECVEVTGHLSDPAAVASQLRRCDLFVLPSLWEGMPNGLLEALACGVPVIASDAGGIPEIVEDGVSGVVIPRTHLHQLGSRILDFLRWPRERVEAMVSEGLRVIARRHTPEVERRGLQDLLAKMHS